MRTLLIASILIALPVQAQSYHNPNAGPNRALMDFLNHDPSGIPPQRIIIDQYHHRDPAPLFPSLPAPQPRRIETYDEIYNRLQPSPELTKMNEARGKLGLPPVKE